MSFSDFLLISLVFVSSIGWIYFVHTINKRDRKISLESNDNYENKTKGNQNLSGRGVRGYENIRDPTDKEIEEMMERDLEEFRKEEERKEKERIKKWKETQKKLDEEREREELRKKQDFWFGLNGRDTEIEVDKVFNNLGYETVLTSSSNDGGLDHILNGEIVVQTKNQKQKVSRPELQKFWGSWKDEHNKGIFISIHGYSSYCKEFVKDKPILLYDVDDVIRMSEGKKPIWRNK